MVALLKDSDGHQDVDNSGLFLFSLAFQKNLGGRRSRVGIIYMPIYMREGYVLAYRVFVPLYKSCL